MKNYIKLISITLMSLLLSSCDAIVGIFKAGMGFGIFIVVAIIVLIVIFISRSSKK